MSRPAKYYINGIKLKTYCTFHKIDYLAALRLILVKGMSPKEAGLFLINKRDNSGITTPLLDIMSKESPADKQSAKTENIRKGGRQPKMRGKKVSACFYINKTMKKALEKIADKQKMTFSNLVLKIVKEYLTSRQSPDINPRP